MLDAPVALRCCGRSVCKVRRPALPRPLADAPLPQACLPLWWDNTDSRCVCGHQFTDADKEAQLAAPLNQVAVRLTQILNARESDVSAN